LRGFPFPLRDGETTTIPPPVNPVFQIFLKIPQFPGTMANLRQSLLKSSVP